MSIEKNIPQIAVLRSRVEEHFGRTLTVHSDFLELMTEIEKSMREHISESTLERVWGYSTRGYNTISLRTLNVLATYATGKEWKQFCEQLAKESNSESDIFCCKAIYSDELAIGDRLRIAWMPDRVCIIRYEGNNRFVAELCENSKMRQDDTFCCAAFYLGHELYVYDLHRSDGECNDGCCYVMGKQNGLTALEKL